MSEPDDYVGQVLHGLALILDAEEVGTYRYEDDDDYLDGERAIWIGDIPGAYDGESIGIANYLETPGVVATNSLYVQVRVRGTTGLILSTRTVDKIRNALHRRANVNLGTVRASLILLESTGRLGTDANGRYLFSSNFRIIGSRGSRP